MGHRVPAPDGASRGHLTPRRAAPTSPDPRSAHLEMVGAVLAGDGLERVAEIASSHAGAPVAVIVPRLGAPVEGWGTTSAMWALAWPAAGRSRPAELKLEVPIASGGRELGAVLMLGRGCGRRRVPHMAAIAALTEVAVAEASDETEQSLRGSFLEEAADPDRPGPGDVPRRRPGSAVTSPRATGAVRRSRRARARQAGGRARRRGARRTGPAGGGRSTRCCRASPTWPAGWPRAWAATRRWGSRRTTPRRPTCARARGGRAGPGRDRGRRRTPGEEIGGGTYRLLFRVLASHPQEVRSFYEDTIAPLVRTTSSTPPTCSARSTPISRTTAT